jgi:hypothetical protein
MANTSAQRGDTTKAAAPGADMQGAGATARPATEATKAARKSGGNADVTRLDEHTDAPSITAPGDGPADTTDPTERASTVGGDKAAAVLAGHLTVNAAVPMQTDERGQLRGVAISYPGDGDADGDGKDGGDRIETYPATRPNGETVTVRHNIDTGVTEIS